MTFACARRPTDAVVPTSRANGDSLRIASVVTAEARSQRLRAAARPQPLFVSGFHAFADGIVELAKQHGLPAVALTDTGNLHGAVEFVQAAKEAGHQTDPRRGVTRRRQAAAALCRIGAGYHNLCRLLSRHAERTATDDDEASVANQQRRPFRREELDGLTEGLIAVSDDARLAEMFPHRFYQHGDAHARPPADFPAVACPAIHYADAADRQKL